MGNNNDSSLWRGNYLRQLTSIKCALHSLRVQTQEMRAQQRQPKSVQAMEHTFAAVEAAFQALHTPEPKTKDSDADFIPGPKGRREFLRDLRDGEVRT